jgi:hypothetical protein
MNPSRCVELIKVWSILKNPCNSVFCVDLIEFLDRSSYTYILQVQLNFITDLVALYYVPFVIYIALLSLLSYYQSRLGKVLGFTKLRHNILCPSGWIKVWSYSYSLITYCYQYRVVSVR